MYIHPPHGATQTSNPNFTSEGVANSSQNPSNPTSASEGVANSSQNPSNPASASEGIANPSQKPSWVEEVLLPSMGAEEAEAAARSAHVWTAAKGLRS